MGRWIPQSIQALQDSRHLTHRGRFRYVLGCAGGAAGRTGMGERYDNVLDTVMLESLAVIAAANDRSLVEELNRAVESYVLDEIASHGERGILKRALARSAQPE